MQVYISKSIDFKNVIDDLADEMNAKSIQNCDVHEIFIPEHLGKGSIKGINFNEGLGLMQYDCYFHEDTEIQFLKEEIHPLKFIFCEEGEFSHRFQNESQEHHIESLQNVMVASKETFGHIIKFKTKTHVKINKLEIDRKKFYESHTCEISKIKGQLKGLFKDINAKKPFFFQGGYSLQTANVFKTINEFRGSTFMKHLFLHSKCYKIFYIMVRDFQQLNNPENLRTILLKHEVNLINDAARLINNDLKIYKTVRELARELGTNTQKLQYGFKEIFGQTVNQYMQTRRLDEAIILLRNTDLSITQISDRVGIKSKSYLTKIFKIKYGITPMEFKKDLKEKHHSLRD